MISYLRGNLIDRTDEGNVIIDVNGVGYEVCVPAGTLAKLREGEEAELYTYLSVKEDGMSLFGFSTREEMQVFKKIITVSGIGPKGGISILSIMSREQFITAVLSDDDAAISKANGVGKKTAQKIVLELKDKFTLEDAFGASDNRNPVHMPAADSSAAGEVRKDAIAALVALGYTNSEAMKAVNSVDITDEMTVDKVLKAALKNI